MTTMTTMTPKLMNMGYSSGAWGARRAPDPAEPGGLTGRADGDPGATLLTRTGIRRVSYFLKASLIFSKACLRLPLA
jgi:hypothetical protein